MKKKFIIISNSPSQVKPSPSNPSLQVHSNDPSVLLHLAFAPQLSGFEHSFISVVIHNKDSSLNSNCVRGTGLAQ